MPRYEFVEDGSSKFWEIEIEGRFVTVRFGRIGSAGQTKKKEYPTSEAATAEYGSLIRKKTASGYRLAVEGASPPSSAKAPAKSRPFPQGRRRFEQPPVAQDPGWFFEIELNGKVVHCRHGALDTDGLITERSHSTVPAAQRDASGLVELKERDGFVEIPAREGGEDHYALFNGSILWKAEVSGTQLLVTHDRKQSTMFFGSTEAALTRARGLADEQRKRGFVDRVEKERAKISALAWSKATEVPADYQVTTGGAGEHGALVIHRGVDASSGSVLSRCTDGKIVPIVRATWAMNSVCSRPSGWVVLGAKGEALALDETGEQAVGEAFAAPHSMRKVRRVGDAVFAVGMGRGVFRRGEDGLWSRCDAGLADSPRQVCGFEDVDGFSPNELYAVGWGGEIWHFDGARWNAVPPQTQQILTAVCCAGDGHVYAVGRSGTLLRGRKDSWSLVPHKVSFDLWGVAWFKGRLYVSSLQAVFRLEPDFTHRAEDTVCDSTYHLTASNEALWSIGAHGVARFDGEVWVEIVE